LKNYKLKIFCDFDGTVTKNDVWVAALSRFINDKEKWDVVCQKFGTLEITARECIRRELELVQGFDFDLFNSYLEQEELDDYFIEFMDYCKEEDFKITLVSEGMDYYVKYILNKYNIDLPLYSNKLMQTETEVNGKKEIKLSCEFPYADEVCNWCGMSKRNVLINNTNDFEGEISVFIGDGISDCCVSNYADIVFAKKSLASYCWKNNITYFDYKNFKDVKNKLISLTEKRKLTQRQTARVLRKDVLLGG